MEEKDIDGLWRNILRFGGDGGGGMLHEACVSFEIGFEARVSMVGVLVGEDEGDLESIDGPCGLGAMRPGGGGGACRCGGGRERLSSCPLSETRAAIEGLAGWLDRFWF